MGLFSFFKRNKVEEGFQLDSRQPYKVICDDDEGVTSYRTFTEQLRMGSDREVRLPVKFIYDADNLYQMILYFPAKDIVEKIKERRANPVPCLVSVWIWFDDGSFIINFPEECDMDFDPNGEIIWCHIVLGKTGFDSEAKKLQERYATEGEISRFIIDKLINHDIIEIEPKIVTESQTFEGASIKLYSPTTVPFKKALKSLQASF